MDPASGAFAFACGLLAGSFLNVVIQRLPAGESLLRPRSRCPRCQAPVRLCDNVPLASWIWLGGRCRDCRGRISLRYPLVEAMGGAVALWAVAAPEPIAVVTRAAFGSLLLALALTDWERMVLPDALTLPGALVGFLLAGPRADLDLLSALAGALLGGGLILGLRAVWRRLRGIEAVGLGDAKLLLLIGAFLGPAPTLTAITLAAAAGVVIAGPLLLLRKIRRETPLPFGSLLALGAAAAFIGGGGT